MHYYWAGWSLMLRWKCMRKNILNWFEHSFLYQLFLSHNWKRTCIEWTLSCNPSTKAGYSPGVNLRICASVHQKEHWWRHKRTRKPKNWCTLFCICAPLKFVHQLWVCNQNEGKEWMTRSSNLQSSKKHPPSCNALQLVTTMTLQLWVMKDNIAEWPLLQWCFGRVLSIVSHCNLYDKFQCHHIWYSHEPILDWKVLDSTHSRRPKVFVLSSSFLGKNLELLVVDNTTIYFV
jgi:hypothetical protein